jgi:hypothetical protein
VKFRDVTWNGPRLARDRGESSAAHDSRLGGLARAGEREKGAGAGGGPIVTVVFGYLFGIILRLLMTKWADRCSAAWITKVGGDEVFGKGNFPYTETLREQCSVALDADQCNFYNEKWAPGPKKHNVLRFDFIKTVVATTDPSASAEIAAAEALSRFVSGMFYGLLVSTTLIVAVVAAILIQQQKVHSGLVCLTIIYLGAIWAILSNFRYLRMYEVEKVFALAYKNRHLFETGMAASKSKDQTPSSPPHTLAATSTSS